VSFIGVPAEVGSMQAALEYQRTFWLVLRTVRVAVSDWADTGANCTCNCAVVPAFTVRGVDSVV